MEKTQTYLVAYDLRRPGQDYPDLIKNLESFSIKWHIMQSKWIIHTPLTAKELRDRLKKFLDTNDKLLVVKTGGVAAWTGFSESGNEWLKKYI